MHRGKGACPGPAIGSPAACAQSSCLIRTGWDMSGTNALAARGRMTGPSLKEPDRRVKNGTSQNFKKMRLATWNINSVRLRIDLVQVFCVITTSTCSAFRRQRPRTSISRPRR